MTDRYQIGQTCTHQLSLFRVREIVFDRHKYTYQILDCLNPKVSTGVWNSFLEYYEIYQRSKKEGCFSYKVSVS